MFYVLDNNNKIAIADNSYARLQATIDMMPALQGHDILETENEIVEYDGKYYFADDAEYIAKKEADEAERIAKLHLTRGDVFRALLLAKGVTRTQLRAIIEAMPEETQEQMVTKEMALIDFDEALEFYRGVALIDMVGTQLGISSEQMTMFFETNDYHDLIGVTE